jgi:DNA-binding MurR/RpiR family transcriptional regulator
MPEKQKKLADFIVRHSENIPFMSVHELAKKSKVSVATVSRFAQDLGFDSFKEFRKKIGKDSLFTFEGIFEEIGADDDDAVVVEKVFSGNIKSIEDTLGLLKVKDLQMAAAAIRDADRFICFGIGGSGCAAQDAAIRFSQVDIQAEAYTDPYQMVTQALRTDVKSVVLGISHSGASKVTVEALKLARSNGAFTLGLSNYLRSPLQKASVKFFCTSFPEQKVEAAALSSRIAQFCIIDALYLMTARYVKVSRNLTKGLNRIIEKELRI